jgi:plastocyanin
MDICNRIPKLTLVHWLFGTILLLVACSAGAQNGAGPSAVAQRAHRGAAAPKHYTIVMRQVSFEPSVLTVGVGDTVEWRNDDIVPHTATSDKKGFDSGIVASAAAWRFIAKKKGTYSYTCTLHPNMKGKLVVR